MAKPSSSAALRKELRAKIIARIEQLDLLRSAAEKTLGMTAAQISRLEGNEDIFSLDRLVDAAVRIGLSVRISATRPYGRK
jgi:predicted XRE-type DNA-binding protein